MSDKLNEITDLFQSVEPDMRLELLLDYANRLPPLPERLLAEADSDAHRVHECQTPLFLWVEPSAQGDDRVDIHIQVAEEAPTVKGIASILVEAYSGQPAAEVTEIPSDLLNRLGLGEAIRMTRIVGLSALLARIRREAAAATTTEP
ncbi:MAG: SufE family protein [Phycisphaeraceae bacterium]